jgi:adenosylcobinamide-GDP ribazoletransferase
MFGRLWAAFGFLTILPLPAWCRQTEEDLPRSVPLFPLVGLAIGGLVGGVAYLAATYLPHAVAAVAYTLLLAVAHGGLHLDGLADTGDGFFSHRQRERILAIMQDARIGAYGCVTLMGVLALKVP